LEPKTVPSDPGANPVAELVADTTETFPDCARIRVAVNIARIPKRHGTALLDIDHLCVWDSRSDAGTVVGPVQLGFQR
jgi:hypothetical protein